MVWCGVVWCGTGHQRVKTEQRDMGLTNIPCSVARGAGCRCTSTFHGGPKDEGEHDIAHRHNVPPQT